MIRRAENIDIKNLYSMFDTQRNQFFSLDVVILLLGWFFRFAFYESVFKEIVVYKSRANRTLNNILGDW